MIKSNKNNINKLSPECSMTMFKDHLSSPCVYIYVTFKHLYLHLSHLSDTFKDA